MAQEAGLGVMWDYTDKNAGLVKSFYLIHADSLVL